MMNKNLPIPINEVSRLDALAQYNILDTLPEEEFDRLTQLASIICGVPIALISLIDKDRQWFKSKIGLNAPETPRDISFCQYTINGESLFEIEDATKDERFLNNPLVTDQPNIRFYAGHPLIDPDGYALGSLCVIDRKARTLTSDQKLSLTLLANEVVSQIVLRKKNAEKEKLEKLFNLSIDLICVMGTDGYLKKINPAFTITLGWTKEELLAKPFINFLHPDDITRTINQIEKLKRGEKSISFENRYITKNGNYLTISWTAIPDEITGERYVIARDITERKKAEAEKEKVLSILQKSLNEIYVFNADTLQFEYVNEGALRNLGYSLGEMLEMKAYDIKPEFTMAKFHELIAPLINHEKEKIVFETIHKRADSSLYPVEVHLQLVTRAEQSVFLAIILDITKKKQTEIALLENMKELEDYKFALDQSAITAITDGNGIIKTVNDNFCAISQFSREELVGNTHRLTNSEFHPEAFYQELWDTITSGKIWRRLMNNKKKNGEYYWTNTIIVPFLDANNKPFQYLAISIDITEAKNAEEALRMVHQRSAQHLINSPLAVIEVDENSIIREWSPQAENIFGWSKAEVLNKHFNEINLVFEEDNPAVDIISKELMSGTLLHNKSSNRNKTKSGNIIHCEWFNSVLEDDEGNVSSVLSLVLDVTERKKMDLIFSGEKSVMKMVATEKPLSNILSTIALNYESYSTNAICSILLLNEEGTHIRHGAGPSLPDAYNKWIDGLPIGPVAGSCGTALYRKERVIVSDIATDPLWVNYRDFALGFGLKACWSTPIINAEGKVYGTFAVYYKECQTPDEADFQLIDWANNQVSIALERYYKDAQLKESEGKYRNFIEQAADGIFLFNRQGNILSVNTSGCKQTGYAKKYLLKMNLTDILPAKYTGKLPVDLDSLNKGEPIFIEKQFRRKDGNVIDTEVSVQLLDDGNIQAIVRDVTERKNAEKKIRRVFERYDILARATSDTIWDWNIVKNRMKYNEGITKIFGYEVDKIDKATDWWKNNIHPADHPAVSASIDEAFDKKNKTIQMEYRYRCADNSYKHIHDRAFVMYDETGKPIRMIGAMQDVTEKKNLAIEVSKAKESFLANMSHEIRTPLNAIIGFLRELGKEELSDLQKTYIDNSSIASKHLLAILNNILDLSKIEAGEMSLEVEDFLIEETVNNVLKVLGLKAKQKEIRLTSLISYKVNKVFKGDSLRLEQILFNLIGNALKFTQKGKIDVSCELLSDSNISQIIRISVADTGIGMEQKYAESIFEKFSQEDKSITRKYGGTGLGMAITKELVDLMGGEIEIESEKNKGTTIHVKINLIKGNIENVKKLQAKVDFNLKGLSILLVEDNEMNRMVLQNALQYFNCDVTEAENGLEAVEILKIRNFDLILMDIQMPEMDGIEATKVIREELKLSTPIIALTANVFKSEIEKCKQAGMNDYVVKPFEETALLQTIVKHTINKNGIPSLDNEMNPNQPLYNLNVLHNLSKGNDEFVLKLVGVFVEQTLATIEKIDAALESNNFLEISQLIHKIRPSTDNMGVLSIQSEMKTLEKIAKETQNKGQITAIYTLVKKTLQLVISQLQKNELNA